MMRWWRSHSIRVRLSLWYVATMVIVLGVYAGAILAFVNPDSAQGWVGLHEAFLENGLLKEACAE